MEEYGLVLQERLNFSEYFQKHKDDCTDKVDWRNMNVAGVEGNMEQVRGSERGRSWTLKYAADNSNVIDGPFFCRPSGT